MMGLRIPNVYTPSVYTAAGRYSGAAAAELLTKGIRLDGVNEDVEVESGGSGCIGGASTDASAFIWYKTSGGSNTTLYSQCQATFSWSMVMQPTGKLYILVRADASNYKLWEMPTATDDNAWHHAGFTFAADVTDGTFILYQDGSAVTPTQTVNNNVPAIWNPATDRIRLGNNNGASYFAGDLAGSVAFQGIALSAGEVAELYDSGGPTAAIRPIGHSQAASIAHSYDAMVAGDDMTGTTGKLQDAAGLAADGTPSATESGDLITL